MVWLAAMRDEWQTFTADKPLMDKDTTQRVSRDAEIAAEVARIRREHPYQGNYREQMAALLSALFFKFGERVGANRLAALLAENGRSPSTSTAQDEINKFWERMRANAAVKVMRPDVPPFLLDLFGEMAARVWDNSMTAAAKTFEEQRAEWLQQVESAHNAVTKAQDQIAIARQGTQQALASASAATTRAEELAAQLAKEIGHRRDLETRNAELTERLLKEQQLRANEAAKMQGTLQELSAHLEQASREQNRLMVIADDFKQQAARDRALRERAEVGQKASEADVETWRQRAAEMATENARLSGELAAQAKQLRQKTEVSEPQKGKLRRHGLRPRVR